MQVGLEFVHLRHCTLEHMAAACRQYNASGEDMVGYARTFIG
jgi:hypothetical protein